MASESKTGQPAGKPKTTPKTQPRKKRGLQLDQEQQARFLLYGATAAVVLIAIALVGFGYYFSVIQPRNRTVLEADNVKVSYNAMVRRMEYEYFTSSVFQQQPSALPEATYLNLLNELTLVNRAESDLGVTLTPEEVDQELRRKVGVAQDADPATFADRYRTALKASGLTDNEYRRLARAEALETKVRDNLQLAAPASVPQARLEVIQVRDEDAARAAISRINGGEDFATVARELSTEADVETTGGVKEFAPEGSFNAVYDSYAFTSEVGKLSDPALAGPGGTFYIVRVAAREDRPLTEDQKPAYVSQAYAEWLTATQEMMNVQRDWEPDAQADALLKVLQNSDIARAPLQPQQPIVVPTAGQQPPADPVDANPPGADPAPGSP